eukprot:9028424-Pyramimonas_sp.AAC.1
MREEPDPLTPASGATPGSARRACLCATVDTARTRAESRESRKTQKAVWTRRPWVSKATVSLLDK